MKSQASVRSIQLAIGTLALSAITGLSNPNAASAVTITYEAPNVVAASSSVGATVKNDFESLSISTGNYANYPNSTFSFIDAATTHSYTATYDNLEVAKYGNSTQTAGAGYTGKFAVNTKSTSVTNPAITTTNLTFTDNTASTAAGIKYFGLFFSSLDAGNQLTFYNGNAVIAQLSISNFSRLVSNSSSFNGGPYSQPGVFFNFYADAGEQFTKIAFTQTTTGGGFEHDNHTFRVPDAEAVSGTGVNLGGLTFTGNVNTTAIPEPFTIIGSIIGGTAAFRMRKKLKAIAD
jgi:hypothetical protein